MTENKSSNDKSKQQYNEDHYDMLMRCSDAGDMSEWNSWSEEQGEKHPNITPQLQEAKLGNANLQGADLGYAELQGADLRGANLQGADLVFANLQGANLVFANLQGANLMDANLQGAVLTYADLQGANLMHANLQGADLRDALVDGLTNLSYCQIDRNTYFGGVALGVPRMNPGLRTALEGNIRRIEWGKWYKKHNFLQWPIRRFWEVSDYGMSTGRVMATFFRLALAFGLIYYLFPDLIYNLKEVRQTGEPPILVSGWMLLLRAVYFSVVTMTTLGFGDMYANPSCPTGHILLMLQVLLGYGLLGALVTRLAVLFNSLGPAQEYAPTDEKQEGAKQTDKN